MKPLAPSTAVALPGARDRVREILRRHGLHKPRVFGSTARGEDTAESNLDLLVDVESGFGLMAIARAQRQIEELLGVSVQITIEGSLQTPAIRDPILREAVPL